MYLFPEWYRNKVMHPWYLPSLLRFLTKIPHDDWDVNRRDTNINEGSHPATNQVTGKGLTLLEGIERYVSLFTFLLID